MGKKDKKGKKSGQGAAKTEEKTMKKLKSKRKKETGEVRGRKNLYMFATSPVTPPCSGSGITQEAALRGDQLWC